jgi:hypothetical protein
MSYLLIPAEAEATSAIVWLGALDEPTDPATLEVVPEGRQPVPVQAWDHDISGGPHRVQASRIRLDGLPTRSRQRVELKRGTRVLATATTGTLPDRLPGIEERPFTILLGSCFARGKDGAGLVGRTYGLLPTGARPDLKILCGDQVYLDAPSVWTVIPSVTEEELRRRLLETYIAAWTQEPGFHGLLADGPNVFTSDDHDFWNNAPNGSITAPATLVEPLRVAWWREASKLYGAFQRPLPAAALRLEMDGLSICVADSRANRTRGRDRFLSPEDLVAIGDWAAALTAPGCLVLGQLVFANPGGWLARMADLGLPDFAQYRELVDALARASHSIVLLSGDVHFGRVSVCTLEPGRELMEVVASPLSLVARFPSNEWKRAARLYPPEAIPGRVQRPITTEEGYRLNRNHFATVEFSRGGGFVRVRVRAWPTDLVGRLPVPTQETVRWIA